MVKHGKTIYSSLIQEKKSHLFFSSSFRSPVAGHISPFAPGCFPGAARLWRRHVGPRRIHGDHGQTIRHPQSHPPTLSWSRCAWGQIGPMIFPIFWDKIGDKPEQNGHSRSSRLVWCFLITTKQANMRYPSLMSRVNSVRDDSLSTATAFSSETAKNFPSVSSDTLGAQGDVLRWIALAAGCWPSTLEVFVCTWGCHFHRSSCQPNTTLWITMVDSCWSKAIYGNIIFCAGALQSLRWNNMK